MNSNCAPIPYAPIERHGVIGDRRTAALIAADGTLDFLCLPRYDGEPAFASLIDAHSGHFRFGPQARVFGEQSYVENSAVLSTRFRVGGAELLALDAMAFPERSHSEAALEKHVIIRRLCAQTEPVACGIQFRPRAHAAQMRLFCTHARCAPGESARFVLRPGEVAWAVLSCADETRWDAETAAQTLADTSRFWQAWTRRLHYDGPYRAQALRSLITIGLLGYEPAGSTVAAPTTSLPERIGGDWNADYRLAWVRDNSLSFQALARHGMHDAAQRYFDWLVGLGTNREAPLEVLYAIDGARGPRSAERSDFAGYRESTPVRSGNHAQRQKQLGCAGYLAACAKTYFESGAPWHPEYFELIAREADFLARHWDEPDNGIWELALERNHVSSRVMSWVALSRASELARGMGRPERARDWRSQMHAIHAQVIERGYSQKLGAFRQEYDTDALDASELLIPIFGFLPAADPRVVSTVDRIASELTINGHVHRFDPEQTAGVRPRLPLGEYEGSFALCTCWLACAYALGGRHDRAAETLERVHDALQPVGLIPEGIDARSKAFRGNYPLLFSHAEHVRALTELARATEAARGRGVR